MSRCALVTVLGMLVIAAPAFAQDLPPRDGPYGVPPPAPRDGPMDPYRLPPPPVIAPPSVVEPPDPYDGYGNPPDGYGALDSGCAACMELPAPPPLTAPPLLYLPAPPARPTPANPRLRFFSGGLTLFFMSWGSTAFAAALAGQGELAIPVVGPIVLDGRDHNRIDPSLQAGLIVDAIAQTAGVIMTIVGATSIHHQQRRVAWTGNGLGGKF